MKIRLLLVLLSHLKLIPGNSNWIEVVKRAIKPSSFQLNLSFLIFLFLVIFYPLVYRSSFSLTIYKVTMGYCFLTFFLFFLPPSFWVCNIRSIMYKSKYAVCHHNQIKLIKLCNFCHSLWIVIVIVKKHICVGRMVVRPNYRKTDFFSITGPEDRMIYQIQQYISLFTLMVQSVILVLDEIFRNSTETR